MVEKWSVERWKEHVFLNATDPSGLVTCAAALDIAQQDRKNPGGRIIPKVHIQGSGQAQAAFELAALIPVEELEKLDAEREKEALRLCFVAPDGNEHLSVGTPADEIEEEGHL